MSSTLALLICTVGARRFALPTSAVVEILPLLPLWRPPTLPRPIAGFAQVRGRSIAVLSTAMLFDEVAAIGPVGLHAHLVHVRGDLALLVDRAEAVVAVAADEVAAADPDLSWRGCVTGEVAVADARIPVVAPDRLLDAAERARTATLAEGAARRADAWAVTP